MLRKLRTTLLIISFFFSALGSKAEALSYVYIQGDKQTPFYVKLDGEMQPRYGKNYCIIPKLAAGPIQIEILFQQNEYPAEKFTILVPEDGFRGFMLTKKEGAYSLYDLQQGFYLSPGNAAEDDIAPRFRQNNTVTEPVKAEEPKPQPITSPRPADPKPSGKPVASSTRPVKKTAKPVSTPTAQTPKPANNEPKFIDNIELNSERTFGNETTNSLPVTTNETKVVGVSNSDCPKPLPFSEYQSILEKARGKSDNNRLKYLLEQTDKCYTTVQVRALTRSLTKDPERYAFLKEIFPHVTDQSNFSMLEATLQSKEWKDYFKLILP